MEAQSAKQDGTASSVFRLKVKNIPIDLEKEALENVFREFGQPTGVQLIRLSKKGENLGYVTFSNYAEAERAIKGLNNKLPLGLSVEFEDKDLKNLQKSPKIDLSRPINDFRYTDSCLDHIQPVKKLIDTGIANCTPDFQPNTYSHSDELFYEYPTDLTTFNPYESSGPYRNTNLMYTRGTVHMNGKDGTRHVAYGRGYTFYKLPEPNPYVGSYIQSVIEKREKGLYEFAPENEEESSSICKICSTPTRFRCQQCEITYYCTRQCQIEDWPKHKSECQSIPPLVRKVITKPAVQNGDTPVEANHVDTTQKEKIIPKPKQTSNLSHEHVEFVQKAKLISNQKKSNDVSVNVNNVKEEKIIEKIEKNMNMPPENNLSQQLQEKLIISKISDLPNILEKLKVGMNGFIMFHAEVGQGKVNVSLVPKEELENFSKLIEDLKNDCLSELTKEPNYRPKIGELICGETIGEDWYRGIVLSTNPVIQLGAIDEARVFVPTKIAPMPQKYSCISKFGLSCEFSKESPAPPSKIQGVTGEFEVVEVSAANKSAIVKVSADDPKFTSQARIAEWSLKPEQAGIRYAPLVSGQEVIITDFTNQNLIYVKSQEKEELERVHLLEQKIAKYALNCNPLNEPPVVGQMVLSQFSLDGNFYRAIVNKIEGNKVMIVYIDYGNEEPTTLDKLFELPEELKVATSGVSKVMLKDVPEQVPMNQETSQYFSELTGNKVVLKCTFSGHPIKDGVTLTTLNNENVNKNIASLLKPSWEKKDPADDTKVYMVDDLPVQEIGNVGEEVEAILLHYYENNGLMCFAPNDYSAAQAIQGDLTEKINKYVESTTQHYIPRKGELCVAKYVDSFYRAMCLEHSCAPDESRVYFIDFGNSERVKHKDIRVFTEEFVSLPPFGVICNIQAMVPEDKFTPKCAKRIAELATVNESHTIQIVKIEDDEEPSIDVPEIRKKLIEEKLL